MSDSNPDSAWCVVANVAREPHPEGPDGGLRLGLKHFAPGAKLYLHPIEWGDGGEKMRAIGKHRGGPGLVEIVVATRWLINWRAKQVFDPRVVRKLRDRGGWTREDAESFATKRSPSLAPEATRCSP